MKIKLQRIRITKNRCITYNILCMNKLMLFLGVLLCLSSCKSESYKDAIADWIQTDDNGTWTDLKFELIDTDEIKDITVADSIRILQDEKERKISLCNEEISRLTKEIEKAEKGMSGVAPSTYFKNRDRLSERKSLLKLIQSSDLSLTYNNREKTEVLVKLVKCKYSIISPMLQTRQEKTETFILSSDLKKCVGRLKNTAN